MALLGGGWFTYRSFAATSGTQATVANGQQTRIGNATVISEPQKNNTQVIRLGKDGTAKASFTLPVGKLTRICVTAKTSKVIIDINRMPTSGFGIMSVNGSGKGAGGKELSGLTTSYTKICPDTSFRKVTAPENIWNFTVDNHNNDSQVFVSMIEAEIMEGVKK